MDAYNAGHYREAAEMYTTHLGEKKDDAHGWYMLGLSRWKSGDLTGAKDALDRSIVLGRPLRRANIHRTDRTVEVSEDEGLHGGQARKMQNAKCKISSLS